MDKGSTDYGKAKSELVELLLDNERYLRLWNCLVMA